MEQRFDNSQMSGRTYRKKFSEAFNDAEKNRQKEIVHLLKR